MVATFERSAAAIRVPASKQILFKLRHNYMEIKNDKTLYEAPSTMVFEVKTEGVICQSGVNANRNGYGAANELTWDE